MYYRYFTSGSEDEKEGLTTVKFSYYNDGQLAVGVENIKSIYKGKEISKEEYDSIQERISNPDTRLGIANGILSDVGFEKYKKYLDKLKREADEENKKKIALSVKKIKKLLQLEIIEQGDVDMEIEQQGMTMFKDEIKKRLEEN